MARCGFLTNHARVLLCIAHDPGARLRDIAASLGITERSAHGIVTDLAGAGYVIRQKDGHRNRYRVQVHLPVPEPGTRETRHRRSRRPVRSPGSACTPQAHTAIAERPVRRRSPAGAPAPADHSLTGTVSRP